MTDREIFDMLKSCGDGEAYTRLMELYNKGVIDEKSFEKFKAFLFPYFTDTKIIIK